MVKKNQNTTHKDKAVNKNSAINILFSLPGVLFTCCLYVLGSILIGIIIEFVGMTFFWEKDHAEQILRTEFAYLGDNFSTTIFGVSAEEAALRVINALNSYVRGSTETDPTIGMLIIRGVESLGQELVPYTNAAIYVTMITCVRVIIIILSIGMFLIVGIAACVDGLYQRELRKVGGDDEHGDVYHYAKSWSYRVIILSPVIYLAWPSAINPNFILLPALMLFFWAIYLTFFKYKKVL